MIKHQQIQSISKDDEIKGKPFQIFGFDILIDSDLKAWVLEINDHPSLSVINCPNEKKCQHFDCPIS